MHEFDLPNINPIMITDNNILAYIDSDNATNPIVPLYVSDILFSYNDQYIKSILFHEFTHIYDANITFKEIIDNENLISAINAYTEYHASQIEILSNIGYNSIFKKNKFNINAKIYYKNEMMDIEHYLVYPLSDATLILNKERYAYINLSNDEYNLKYVRAAKNIWYYLGKYNICEIYANRQPCNMFFEFGIFENDIKKIYIALKAMNFEQIQKEIKNYTTHYMTYFKFSI